jgi:hypothetical protein
MQVDIGNVLNGGREPIEIYRKYASKAQPYITKRILRKRLMTAQSERTA